MSNEVKKIDWTKPVRTKSHMSVEILKTDAKLIDGYSVIGLVTDGAGNTMVETWAADGKYYIDVVFKSNMDLENVPEKVKLWIVNSFAKDSSASKEIDIENTQSRAFKDSTSAYEWNKFVNDEGVYYATVSVIEVELS